MSIAATMLRCLVLPGAFLAGSAIHHPASPQTATAPQIISGPPVCQRCSIERYGVATIHDADYPDGAIGVGAAVYLNSDGTFLVNTGFGVWDALYFAGPGGSIRRRIGRLGSGPGEFRIPAHVMETRDSYMVADPQLARITFLDRATLAYQKTLPVPGTMNGVKPVAFSDGTDVFSGTAAGEGWSGHAIHVVSPQGELLRSFGPPVQHNPLALVRSANRTVWAIYRDYRIERWSLEGELLASWRRDADWVRPLPADMTSLRRGESLSMLFGAHEDDAGRLWVKFSIGTWHGTGFEPDAAAYDSIIDVIDTTSGRVFAHSRVAGVRDLRVGGNGFFLASRRETPAGLVVIDISGTRLVIP